MPGAALLKGLKASGHEPVKYKHLAGAVLVAALQAEMVSDSKLKVCLRCKVAEGQMILSLMLPFTLLNHVVKECLRLQWLLLHCCWTCCTRQN